MSEASSTDVGGHTFIVEVDSEGDSATAVVKVIKGDVFSQQHVMVQRLEDPEKSPQ